MFKRHPELVSGSLHHSYFTAFSSDKQTYATSACIRLYNAATCVTETRSLTVWVNSLPSPRLIAVIPWTLKILASLILHGATAVTGNCCSLQMAKVRWKNALFVSWT